MLFDLITIIVSITLLILGGIVYFHNKQSASNRFFALYCIANLFLTILDYLSLHSFLNLTLLWIRLVMLFATLIQFSIFFFIHTFPKQEIQMKSKYFYTLTTIALLTIIATLTPYVFTGFEIKNDLALPHPGILMPLFALTTVIFLSLTIYFLIKRYRDAQGIEKLQWKFISLGFAITYLLQISLQYIAVVIFEEVRFIIFGPIFLLPFVVLSTYAILRYRFMDIEITIKKGAIYTASLAIILALLTILSLFMRNVLIKSDINPVYSDILIILIIAIGFPILKKYFDPLFERLLKQSVLVIPQPTTISKNAQREKESIEMFTPQGSRVVERGPLELYDFIDRAIQEIKRNLKTNEVILYLENPKTEEFFPFFPKKYQGPKITKDNILIAYIEQNPQIVVLEEVLYQLKYGSSNKLVLKEFEKALKLLKMELYCPLFAGRYIVGFFLLSKKSNKKLYTTNDIEWLDKLAKIFIKNVLAIWSYLNLIGKTDELYEDV